MSFWKIFTRPGPRYSGRKAALIIAVSVCITCAILFGGATGYHSFEKKQQEKKRGVIDKIVQANGQGNALATSFFAEVLGLSIDEPTILASLDLEEGEKRLLQTAVVKTAHLKRVFPSTLFINYEIREPFVYSGDFANTAIDKEGVFFPPLPYISHKKIPTVYLDALPDSTIWGEKISDSDLKFIEKLVTLFPAQEVESIDLSKREAMSLGQKQIVVVIREGKKRHILRLTPRRYTEEIRNYYALKKDLLNTPSLAIIDLRLPDVAYLEKNQ